LLTIFTRTASVITVWLIQCIAIYRLYNTTLPDSVRFAIPALLGFLLFLLALRLPLPERTKTPLTISLLYAFLLGFCSFWMGMFISVNAFGA
jgi:hypothetical protein